ncbi:MAG TPA: universal stress protein [Paraburkholderia sp.]|jgi:nucleotide-binding universal stress UspA family protein|nr:universal stress protein [Paraburkholderia sp.]
MYSKILVAMDGSDTSVEALDEALRMASVTGGSLHVVCVVDQAPYLPYAGYYDPSALLDAARQDGAKVLEKAKSAIAQTGLAGDVELTETESLSDDVPNCLKRCADRFGADLVVMGTHGRRGLRRMVLGSVAERFLRLSSVPVLMVRGSGPVANA